MRVSNVPAITPRYWAAILVASMCGANTGDFLSHNLHLGQHSRAAAPSYLVPTHPVGRAARKDHDRSLLLVDPSNLSYVRHRAGAVRPYIHGPVSLWDFVQEVFGAEEIERHAFGPTSFHIEARIADSAIVLETGDPPHPQGTPSSVYVYVPDVDGAYSPGIGDGRGRRVRAFRQAIPGTASRRSRHLRQSLVDRDISRLSMDEEA